jgi:hypothetical protein
MPTITAQTAIREVSRELGFVQFATTTNLTTNTSVVSTDLSAKFAQDDFFNDSWFVIIRGANNDEVVRRVTDYTASSGTLTVAGANLASESGAKTCELHRFDPDRVESMLNQARLNLFPQLCISRELTTIVTGPLQRRYTLPTSLRGTPLQVWMGRRVGADGLAENEVDDPGFEDWTNSTTPAKWTLSGTSATVTQEQQTTGPTNYAVLDGSNSARLYSASSGITTLLQTVTPTVAVEGQEGHVSVWVYCNTASRVAARSGSTDGSTHGGTGWELLTASETAGATATTVSVGVSVSAGGQIIAYVDELILIMGQEDPYDLGWEPVFNWTWIPPIGGASNNGILELPYQPVANRRLRVIGRDVLSSVSADSDTMEISDDQMAVLLDETRRLLSEDAANSSLSGGISYWRERAQEYYGKVQDWLSRSKMVSMPSPKMRIPDWP